MAHEPDSPPGLVFVEFARRLAKGLEGRFGRPVETSASEIPHASPETVARRAVGGALFARTAWSHGPKRTTGCFLWVGAHGGPGDSPRPPAELDAEEVRAIDRTLRVQVGEGGADLGLRWSSLAAVAPGDVADVLRQAGVPTACNVLEIRLGAPGDEMSLLFLPRAAEPAIPEPPTPPTPPPGSPDHLLDVRVPLTIRLGSTRMTLDDVLRLAQGSVVELDQREDEALEVLANGRVVARGEIVVVDERFGLRITEIGSVEGPAPSV